MDSSAAGSSDGTSWANAWTSPAQISGVGAGDTVLISGGPAGSTRTYNMSGYWNPPSGSAGGRITYQIGQDAAHKGTAIFNLTLNPAGNNPWISGSQFINVLGDAGDGLSHFKLTNYQDGASNIQDTRIGYIDASGGIGALGGFNPVNNLELDHWQILITDMNADRVSFAACQGTTWDQNKIHDCTIRMPYLAGTGFGSDCFQWNGNGFSIYNNMIIGYKAAYVAGQHADGWQGLGGCRYIKIYNNTFVDVANYAIFGEAYGGGWTDVMIYNNQILCTDPIIASGAAGGVIFGVSGGFMGTPPCVFTNVVIANNVIADLGTNQASIALNNVTGVTANFVNCVIENNTMINSGTIIIAGNTTSTVTANTSLSTSQASSALTSYTQYNGLLNNLHLNAGATALIGKGANLSSFFSTDKDGNIRAASGAWDLGPFISGVSATVLAPSNALVSITAF